MRTFVKLVAAAAIAASSGFAAAADLIINAPSPSTDLGTGNPVPNCTGGQGGQDTAFLTGSCGVSSTSLEFLYKFDIGGGESGKFQDLFSTTGLTSPGTMTLTDTLAGALSGYTSFWLVVKDGKGPPGRYGYNITVNWAGDGFIQLNNFWTNPSNGEISHVSLFGNKGDTCEPDCFNETPEPATLALAGGALLAAGLIRRRRKA